LTALRIFLGPRPPRRIDPSRYGLLLRPANSASEVTPASLLSYSVSPVHLISVEYQFIPLIFFSILHLSLFGKIFFGRTLKTSRLFHPPFFSGRRRPPLCFSRFLSFCRGVLVGLGPSAHLCRIDDAILVVTFPIRVQLRRGRSRQEIGLGLPRRTEELERKRERLAVLCARHGQ